MLTVCVILNYNDSITTIDLLNSIKEYDELDFIVIVDNKSIDDSYLTLLKHSSEKVRVIQTDKNGGYGYGNNYGIKYAYYILKATHILISNPDVQFNNECVRKLKKSFIEHNECAIIAPIVRDKKSNIIAWKFSSLFKEVANATFIYRKIFKTTNKYSNEYFKDKECSYVDIVLGALFMIEARVMIKEGMYDEEMFLFNEERTLAYILNRSKYKTLLLLNSEFVHMHGGSINKSISSLVKLKKIENESMLIYLRKYKGLKGAPLIFTKIYHKYALIEMFFVSIIKRINKKLS